MARVRAGTRNNKPYYKSVPSGGSSGSGSSGSKYKAKQPGAPGYVYYKDNPNPAGRVDPGSGGSSGGGKTVPHDFVGPLQPGTTRLPAPTKTVPSDFVGPLQPGTVREPAPSGGKIAPAKTVPSNFIGPLQPGTVREQPTITRGVEPAKTVPADFIGPLQPGTVREEAPSKQYFDSDIIVPSGRTTDKTKPIREFGIMTVTEEGAESLRKSTTTTPYWEVSNDISPSDAIRYDAGAIARTEQISSPIGVNTAGTYDINWANIITSKKELALRKDFEKEMGIIGEQFQANPENFSASSAFSVTETDKGKTYQLGEDYFKNLPSYKRYSDMFDESGDMKKDVYIESLNEARRTRTASYGDSFWDRATASSRNVGLTLGESALWVQKTGVGFTEFGATILKNFGVQTMQPGEKFEPFKVSTFSFAESSPQSYLGKLSAAQYAPSTSGFKLFSPSTWNKSGQWIKELPNRPGAALTTGLVIGSAVGITRASAQAFSIERAAGATRTGATGTVFMEGISGLSPIRIKPGIFKTGYENPKDVAAYNVDRKGFIELKVSGKPTGWGTTPSRLSPDEVINSKTLFKDIGTGSNIKYPGEVTTGVARGSEEVFVWGSSRYGWGGVNPSLSGIRIPTVTYIPPITSLTSQPIEGIKGAGRSDLFRIQTEFTKFPIQTSRYGFSTGDKTIITLQKGGAVSVPTSKVDLRYSTKDYFFAEDIAKRTKVSYTDPKTGLKITGDSGFIKPSVGRTRLVATGDSVVDLGMPKEVPDDVSSFTFKGETQLDKFGKITEGVIYPSKTISKVYGSNSFSEVIRGSGETFIPGMKLGGGGGGGSSVSPGGSVSIGGGGGQSSLLSGNWASFNAPMYAPTPTAAFVPSVGPLSFSFSPLSVGALGKFSTSTSTASISSQISNQASISSQISSQATTPISSQISGQSSISSQISSAITTPIITQITTQITTPTIFAPTITKTPTGKLPPTSIIGLPPIIPPPFFFGGKKTKPLVKKQQGYLPQAKSGNKWITLSKQPMSRDSALSRAARAADNTTSSQFRIKKAKGKVSASMDNYFGATQNKYRPYRVKKGQKIGIVNQFIEKKGVRIDTPGEKKGLKLAKYAQTQGWLSPTTKKKKGKKRTKKRTKKSKQKSPWLF